MAPTFSGWNSRCHLFALPNSVLNLACCTKCQMPNAPMRSSAFRQLRAMRISLWMSPLSFAITVGFGVDRPAVQLDASDMRLDSAVILPRPGAASDAWACHHPDARGDFSTASQMGRETVIQLFARGVILSRGDAGETVMPTLTPCRREILSRIASNLRNRAGRQAN
ncbi:hypothetical protein Mp_3g03920 [Marchantia polymorpha subsp. ruderalis]|uniref:Uncharacterized protein n=2 Tax=Marchantia polymorpha TaxID=3197 RepID=A0AAF6AX76_MARPO|nr:hypothetical protein MARPO_0022s0138 [Marchantia polymorpha]BBN04360.1 hypothetical protein Mp_3g03920 [Marchantia polymorpha subsp. ruderalis]|eukprot:PTQ44044.1 hypothetical protein MARPO_0022s0138 [Marchantia polymorpha]